MNLLLRLLRWLSGKVSACQCKETRVRSLSQKDPLEEEWQPTPISCLENPMDREAWWATVHGVTKSQTRLNDRAHTLICLVVLDALR